MPQKNIHDNIQQMVIKAKIFNSLGTTDIELSPESHNEYSCKVSLYGNNKTTVISAYDLQKLFKLIRKSRITVIGENTLMLDTTTYQLSIKDEFSYVEYGWSWNAKGWESLVDIADELLVIAEKVMGQYIR